MHSIYSDLYRNKTIPFQQVCRIAQMILQEHLENLQRILFFYQRYVDTATNVPVDLTYPSLPVLLDHTDLRYRYEVDSNINTLENFWEFRLAVYMYQMNCDAYTAEVASRVNAMTNSTNNAEDMSNSLTLLYNRTRQAKITSELIEIISGASAIE
uniref:F-ATPase gamma subunit n=1 Tax=Lygus hesperus TaxID=30085 RepID=A0A0A9X8F3_LYGHE